jgi:hypothetical protein
MRCSSRSLGPEISWTPSPGGQAGRRDDRCRDRDRHDGVPHRRPSGLLGWTLPGQQPRPAASAARAGPPRATAGWGRCSPSAPGRRPAAATPTYRRSSGGWPAASASRKAAMAVGHPGPGDRLAPAHQRLRLRRSGWRLLRPPRRRTRSPASRRPTPSPRLPGHPPTPRPMKGDSPFSMRPEVQVLPGPPPALTSGHGRRGYVRSGSSAAHRMRPHNRPNQLTCPGHVGSSWIWNRPNRRPGQ